LSWWRQWAFVVEFGRRLCSVAPLNDVPTRPREKTSFFHSSSWFVSFLFAVWLHKMTTFIPQCRITGTKKKSALSHGSKFVVTMEESEREREELVLCYQWRPIGFDFFYIQIKVLYNEVEQPKTSQSKKRRKRWRFLLLFLLLLLPSSFLSSAHDDLRSRAANRS